MFKWGKPAVKKKVCSWCEIDDGRELHREYDPVLDQVWDTFVRKWYHENCYTEAWMEI